MTYPGIFYRVTVIGSIFTEETFNWTLSLIPRSGDSAGGPTEWGGDGPAVAAAIQAFHTTAPTGASTRLQQIKIARIGTDGKYVDDAPWIHDYGSPGISGGTDQTSVLPAQTALAVTLRSDRSRGLANSGRFFLPACGALVHPGTGLIEAQDAQTVADAATTMLSALNDLDGSWMVGIASDTRLGAFQPITRVEVGRVLDTIRSRRRSFPESYVASVAAVDTALAA